MTPLPGSTLDLGKFLIGKAVLNEISLVEKGAFAHTWNIRAARASKPVSQPRSPGDRPMFTVLPPHSEEDRLLLRLAQRGGPTIQAVYVSPGLVARLVRAGLITGTSAPVLTARGRQRVADLERVPFIENGIPDLGSRASNRLGVPLILS
jgi:hypothetical protein